MNRKVGQESINRLVCHVRAGILFDDVMKRSQGVAWKHGGKFTQAGAMQDFLGSMVVRQAMLRHIQQDVQVHRDFHWCLS